MAKRTRQSHRLLEKELQFNIKELNTTRDDIKRELQRTAQFFKLEISKMVSDYIIEMPMQLKTATYGELKKGINLESSSMFSSKLDSTQMDKSAEPKKPAPLRKITRQSRSATRAKYVTPANRRRAQSYDPITPKVEPNTPQMILRTPRPGEMVLSLHGSPLYTGVVASEKNPNVTIPMGDGRHITVHPRGNLRCSSVPDLDAETLRGLAQLRDNLDTLVQLRRT
ncbi:borealin [Aethina tumida]|uniref:borealin n=1 Tax=Aethina tumida TaxID=116153 RepID=UPI002147BFCF|nr:borealin [Aethina tumida]